MTEVKLKRPNPEDFVLSCPVQQSNEVLVKITHEADQVIVNERGVMLDSMNSAQHNSLVETSTINLMQCNHSVIPTNAPLTEDKKSSRSKKNPPY